MLSLREVCVLYLIKTILYSPAEVSLMDINDFA